MTNKANSQGNMQKDTQSVEKMLKMIKRQENVQTKKPELKPAKKINKCNICTQYTL